MKRIVVLPLLAYLLAGCGGGGGGASTPATAFAAKTQTGTLGLTFGAQTGTTSTTRKPAFVSPLATSASIAVNGGTATSYDVSPTSTLCQTANSVRTCAVDLSVPVGLDSISVTLNITVAGKPVMVGQGSNSITVVAGTPFALTVGVNPVVAGVNTGQFTFPSSFTFKKAATATGSITFEDPAGANITGSGNVPNFLSTITLASSDPHITVSPTTMTTPGQTFTLTYDGSPAVAQSVTVTIKSGTTTVASGTMSLPGLSVTRYDLGAPGSVAPEQIAVGPDHDIWWTESTTKMIGRLDPISGTIEHFPSGFTNLIGITAGGDGNMWFSDGAQLIGRISTGTSPAIVGSTITAGIAGSQIGRLIADSSGNVWYEDSGTPKRFGYVDKTTLTPTPFGPTPTGKLTEGTGLTLGADNAIYYLAPNFSGLSDVGRVTTAANGTPGLYIETPIPNTSGSVFPFDLASGSDGKIWISVYAVTATNQFYATFTPGANTFVEYPNIIDPNLFANLVTMFAGPDGNLWIAEGGGAVRITPASPTTPVVQFFTDNAQNTMTNCITGPDSNLWCTAQGSGPNPGFTATNDSIITWAPR